MKILNSNVKLSLNLIVLMVLQVQLLGCSSTSTNTTANTNTSTNANLKNQEQATTKPMPAKVSGLKLPKYYEHTLKNGLRILYLPDSSLPQVQFSAIIKAGATQDPDNLPGLNAMTANLLDEGTKDKTSTQIAEKLEFLGATLSIQPGSDFTTMSAEGLAPSKTELWNYFYEIMTKPAFPDAELKRVSQQSIASLSKLSDEPEAYVSTLYNKVIFDGNAYAYPTIGTTK